MILSVIRALRSPSSSPNPPVQQHLDVERIAFRHWCLGPQARRAICSNDIVEARLPAQPVVSLDRFHEQGRDAGRRQSSVVQGHGVFATVGAGADEIALVAEEILQFEHHE